MNFWCYECILNARCPAHRESARPDPHGQSNTLHLLTAASQYVPASIFIDLPFLVSILWQLLSARNVVGLQYKTSCQTYSRLGVFEVPYRAGLSNRLT